MTRTYPGLLILLKSSTHIVNRGTWEERWFIDRYQTANGDRFGAYRHGVRLSGYASLDALLGQLKSRAA